MNFIAKSLAAFHIFRNSVRTLVVSCMRMFKKIQKQSISNAHSDYSIGNVLTIARCSRNNEAEVIP